MFSPQSDLILAMASTPMPFGQFKDEMMATYVVGHSCAHHTRRKLLTVFGQLERLGVASTDQLTPDLIGRYIASQPKTLSPYTVRGNLMSVRTICSHAEGRRALAISPFRLKRLSKWIRVGPPTGKRHLTADEVRRVLDLMRADVASKQGWALWRARRLYALTSLVAYTGLRAMEAQCVWVEDVDLAGRLINLVPRGPHLPAEGAAPARFKTEAAAQAIALPVAVIPVLEEWLVHRHDHPDGFALPPVDRIPWMFPGSERISAWVGGPPACKPVGRLKALGKRAGVGLVTFQLLRRTWVTRAEALGIPDAMATRQCRHTSTETTKRWYAQRDLDSLKDAVEGFDF
jgi:integrase